MEVWNHFDHLFNIRSFQMNSIQSRRFNGSNKKSQVGYATSMLTIFSVWELWKEGNSSKLENPISQPATIIPKIMNWLKNCSQLLDIRSSWTFTDSILMDALYIYQARKLAIDSKIIVDCFNKNKEAPKITHTLTHGGASFHPNYWLALSKSSIHLEKTTKCQTL
ncbi:hypothetical protein CQW23_25333 [Capsicum baccatum]|uniref:Uncharacterized protein n=1 Tax=Capsicum baccatum TaxID=33114 RepID=A0A2G2VKQ8_CAPBA|nr:hypothetical protein CQW23_25333 [Capsicum baccatum]